MSENLSPTTNKLFDGIVLIIKQAKQRVSVYLNTETTLLYWSIGDFLFRELKQKNHLQYDKQILATLSQQLSWSHLIELASIEDETKRLFYTEFALNNINAPMGISEMVFAENLPENLKTSLPTLEEMQNELEKQ